MSSCDRVPDTFIATDRKGDYGYDAPYALTTFAALGSKARSPRRARVEPRTKGRPNRAGPSIRSPLAPY
jgi:hypothetical protein